MPGMRAAPFKPRIDGMDANPFMFIRGHTVSYGDMEIAERIFSALPLRSLRLCGEVFLISPASVF